MRELDDHLAGIDLGVFKNLTHSIYRSNGNPNFTQTTTNPADFVITSGTNVTGLDFGNHNTGGRADNR